MKFTFFSKQRQSSITTVDSITDANECLLADMLQGYSSRRSDLKFTFQKNDHIYCLSLNDLPFVFSIVDSQIHMRSFFPQVRCLANDCIEDIEENHHIYVDWNDANQAGLSQQLSLNFLKEEERFQSQLDSFVHIITLLAERKQEQRVYRLSSPKKSARAA